MPDQVYILRCRKCGNKWKQRVKAGVEPNLKCKNLACGEDNPSRGFDPAGTPPAIGGSMRVKAVDETAKIVMEDYRLNDLQDNQRHGDICRPKLAPHLQAQADNMFGGGGAPRDPSSGRPLIPAKRMQAIKAAALAGSFGPSVVGGPDPVALVHERKSMPPTNFIAGDGINVPKA